jgi:hypothetical protein
LITSRDAGHTGLIFHHARLVATRTWSERGRIDGVVGEGIEGEREAGHEEANAGEGAADAFEDP